MRLHFSNVQAFHALSEKTDYPLLFTPSKNAKKIPKHVNNSDTFGKSIANSHNPSFMLRRITKQREPQSFTANMSPSMSPDVNSYPEANRIYSV
jgi:hypothetical protein